MSDADVDGSHIFVHYFSLSSFRQMPALIEAGYSLYIAQPPLFKVGRGRSEVYLKDQPALDEYLIEQGIEGAIVAPERWRRDYWVLTCCASSMKLAQLEADC